MIILLYREAHYSFGGFEFGYIFVSAQRRRGEMEEIMYKDIKQVKETKEIILIISKAGYTTFFERKNVESNDLEKLKQFFDKQNILWEKSICNIF